MLVVNVLQTQASAIRMLQARIETIKGYLVDVQDGIPLFSPAKLKAKFREMKGC